MILYSEYPLIQENIYMVNKNADIDTYIPDVKEHIRLSMFNGSIADYDNYTKNCRKRIEKMHYSYGNINATTGYELVSYIGTIHTKRNDLIGHCVVRYNESLDEEELCVISLDDLKFYTPAFSYEGKILDMQEYTITNSIYNQSRLTSLPYKTIGALHIVPFHERINIYINNTTQRMVNIFTLDYKTKKITTHSEELWKELNKKEISIINSFLLSAYNVIPCMFVEGINGYELVLV